MKNSSENNSSENNMDHSGWLEKHSGGKEGGGKLFSMDNSLGKWDKRFFVLTEDGMLSYYKSPKDKAPAGSLDTNGGVIHQDGLILEVITAERTLKLRAASEDDLVLPLLEKTP